MKNIIREGCFESNSSSCHSLSISDKGMIKSKFKMDKDGYIHCDYGVFDDNAIYDSQYDKLSYMLTHAYYDTCGYWTPSEEPLDAKNSDLFEDYQYSYIDEAIKDYIPGCKGIRIDNKIEPELNHQLQGDLDDIVNIWSEDSIQEFIFNKYISLKIYHD